MSESLLYLLSSHFNVESTAMTTILGRLCHVLYRILVLPLYLMVYILRHIKKCALSIYPRRLTSEFGKHSPEGGPDHPITLEEAYNDYAQFSVLSKKSDRSDQVFVSLGLRTFGAEEKRIAGIGLCTWCSDHTSQWVYCYWSIANTIETGKARSGSSESYAYPTTAEISESDIGRELNDHFRSLIEKYQTVVLVGHKVGINLKLLERFWRPSLSLIILDAGLICQYNYQLSTQISPGTVLSDFRDISPHSEDYHIEENDANDTRRALMALNI
ncbi:hypothetical protein GGR50DRAFT_697217 [Xylaria sp. CBS 124048]|nr:hypothetical protein GGR50DRAFT_697217 [Xylaria sp. CBS 124048]